MLLIMVVNLYTSRVILQALGVNDFGLYNIVGGIVVLFTFINNAMVTSTQRFLNFEIGRNNYDEAQKVFSASLNIHFIIAFAFLLLAETVGLWFLNRYIQIPAGREIAANWVYQFSIAVSILNIIRSPYNAAIIAHENMSFYAYISIIEVILKLAIVYLVYLFADRLVTYSCLVFIVAVFILLAYYVFCKKKYLICKYRHEYDRERYMSLASFSGWSLFGSLANVGASQGVNIILNMFFGVAVNAAMGIAQQVNAALYQFVSNFQTAFNPQLVKSYAAGKKEYFFSLILNTSRYSFLLLYILALPVLICCPELLGLWLGNVPDYAVSFTRLIIIFSFIDSLQGPLWVSAQATGNIRNYQLLMSVLILLNLPISYLLLKIFHIPELALLTKVLINVVTAIARVLYLRHLYGFPVFRYLKEVITRCIFVVIFSFPLPLYIYSLFSNWQQLLLTILVSIIITALISYLIGLKSNEKQLVSRVAARIFHYN